MLTEPGLNRGHFYPTRHEVQRKSGFRLDSLNSLPVLSRNQILSLHPYVGFSSSCSKMSGVVPDFMFRQKNFGHEGLFPL